MAQYLCNECGRSGEVTVNSPNAEQIAYWNAAAGRTWAQFQTDLDRQIEPLGREAMRVLAPGAGERVLDIGCGCGQTTFELAERVDPSGSVLGVDISTPMLDVARQRSPAGARHVEFRRLDAQDGRLGTALFDAAFSRFGVMFFSDPVAAFGNIAESLKPGGRLAFVCWRALKENPWMSAPLEAARPFLPPALPQDPQAPGPFAFADAARVRSILIAAGLSSVVTTAYDYPVGGGDLQAATRLALRVGPLGAAIREHPEVEAHVVAVVRSVLQRYVTDDGVRMPSASWIVSARRN